MRSIKLQLELSRCRDWRGERSAAREQGVAKAVLHAAAEQAYEQAHDGRYGERALELGRDLGDVSDVLAHEAMLGEQPEPVRGIEQERRVRDLALATTAPLHRPRREVFDDPVAERSVRVEVIGERADVSVR